MTDTTQTILAQIMAEIARLRPYFSDPRYKIGHDEAKDDAVAIVRQARREAREQ